VVVQSRGDLVQVVDLGRQALGPDLGEGLLGRRDGRAELALLGQLEDLLLQRADLAAAGIGGVALGLGGGAERAGAGEAPCLEGLLAFGVGEGCVDVWGYGLDMPMI